MATKKYRVIQWATGHVGKHALRAIANHPEMELAGLWVSSEAKAGKDAGELCGAGHTGVKATRDADAVLALDADCVSYAAATDYRLGDAIEDMCRILASGRTSSPSFVPFIYPWQVIRHCGADRGRVSEGRRQLLLFGNRSGVFA
jgi:4-hydroxy-tetrahydrodipicolinate reductase